MEDLKGPEKRRAATREKLVAAAQQLFSRNGYHNTQVMDIVSAAGVSAGTFYKYYKDKKDIFNQLVLKNLDDLRARVKGTRQISATKVNLSAAGRARLLREISFETYNQVFDYMEKYPNQMLMTIRGIFGVDEVMDDKALRWFNAAAQDLIAELKQWERIFDLEIKGDKTILAHMILGSLMHLSHIYLTQKPFTREAAVESLVRRHVHLLQ